MPGAGECAPKNSATGDSGARTVCGSGPVASVGCDAAHFEVDASQPQVDEGCAGVVADKERADARDQPAVRVEEMPMRRPVLRGSGREERHWVRVNHSVREIGDSGCSDLDLVPGCGLRHGVPPGSCVRSLTTLDEPGSSIKYALASTRYLQVRATVVACPRRPAPVPAPVAGGRRRPYPSLSRAPSPARPGKPSTG
jgi:hypothetical protein